MNEFYKKFIKQNNLKIFNIDAYSLRGKSFFANIYKYREKILDKQKKRIKSVKNSKCTLCGNKKENSIFLTWKKNYKLLECKNCNSIYPNISHDNEKEFIDSVYNNPNYTEKAFTDIYKNYNYRKKVFGSERYQYCFERLKLKKNSKVLDLGCGFGYFLKFLKSKKINCKGIEPQENIAQFCRKKLNINVVSQPLELEKNSSYDLITLFDVLEHLKNPLDYFKNIKKKLKLGGHCVMYTPNIRSLGYALLGSEQNTMLPFEHICFYDKKSLNFLAKKTGFKMLTLETFGFDIMDYILYRDFKDNLYMAKRFKNFTSLVQSVLDKQNLSNHFRITFKKIR